MAKHIKIQKTILFLTLLLLISSMPVSTFAQYSLLRMGGRAKVLQVIDGDALKVQMLSTGEVALVRLAGVDAEGFDGAVAYMNNELLGHIVELNQDSSMANTAGRWNMMFVYKGNVMINTALLERGYAKVLPDYQGNMKDTLTAGESSGKAREIGLWAPDDTYNVAYGQYYAGNGVNINTCTASQLYNRLEGVDMWVAENVIYYRNYSPFRTVNEIKFVDGFTKEMFTNNRSLLTVSTNINTATETELLSLINFTQADVDRIISYRSSRNFTNVYQLYGENLISNDKYSANFPYINVTEAREIYHAIPSQVANVNTASRMQLVNAGLSASTADRVISNRRWYTYKYIGELEYIISKNELNRLADNLSTVTDLNHAGIDEIRSLFGESAYSGEANKLFNNRPYSSVEAIRSQLSEGAYSVIEKYCTVASYTPSYININGASMEQLLSTGMTESQATSIYNNRLRMREPQYIPVDLPDQNAGISLYTNINVAGHEEIASLLWIAGTDGSSIVNDLINARDTQPFGSMDEVRAFFEERGHYNLYNIVRDFIVLR